MVVSRLEICSVGKFELFIDKKSFYGTTGRPTVQFQLAAVFDCCHLRSPFSATTVSFWYDDLFVHALFFWIPAYLKRMSLDIQ